MSDVIYLKTGQFSNRSFNASQKELKKAADALNILDDHGAMSNTTYTCDGISRPIFSVDVINEASSIANLVNSLHEKLEAYSSLLQSGPDALHDADSSFKGEYTNAWQRCWYSVSSGVSSIYTNTVGFWGSLFRKDGKKTGDKVPVVHEEEATREDSNPEPPKTEEPKELSPYEQYRASVQKANEGVPVGEPQDAREHGSYMCTWASTATILRRKQAVDGYDPTFSRDGVYSTNPSMVFSTSYNDEYGNTYDTISEDSATMSQKMEESSIKSKAEYIKAVLDEHPEGIVAYTNYAYQDQNGDWKTSQHAIVITDYEIRDDGSIQFYADDPVNDRDGGLGRTEIENTWMYKVNPNIIEECFRIWYVS